MATLTAPLPPDLLRQRQDELDALFALLPAATADRVQGHWQGSLMALQGLDWLPRPLAQGLYRLLSVPLNPWRGKSFSQDEGANRWLTLGGAAFGRFRVAETNSIVDGLPVLLLDYDVPANPGLLRHIRGEARELNDSLLLARMNWQGRNGLRRVLYFTLARAD